MTLDFSQLAQDPYIVFRLGGNAYAIPALLVKTMIETPKVIPIPRVPPYVRGVVNLRGSILSLIDLRTRMGLESTASERNELLVMLEQREKDHIHWLNELEASLLEAREFTLQLDPRLCAFGKWYYSYTPPDQWVAGILRNFEEPHNTIHGLAVHIKELQASGQLEEGKKKLESTRERELATMIRLFAQLRKQISDSLREICIVVDYGQSSTAFAVDAVESIEHFEEDTFQDVDGKTVTGESLILCFARRKKDNGVVSMLDTQALLNSSISPPN